MVNRNEWIIGSFAEISRKFRKILQQLCNSQEIWTFLNAFVKFRQNFIKIQMKNSSFDAKFENARMNNYSIQFKIVEIVTAFLLKFWSLSGAKVCQSCRSRKMLKNAYLGAKIGFDTAENEPSKVWQLFIHDAPAEKKELSSSACRPGCPLLFSQAHDGNIESSDWFFLHQLAISENLPNTLKMLQKLWDSLWVYY